MRCQQKVHMIGHDYPGMQVIMFNFDAVFKGRKHHKRNIRLSEKSGAAAGFIQNAVHSDEGLAIRETQGGKTTMCRKTVVQPEGNEQRLADPFEMWKPTPAHRHTS